ncbi:MAG: hypothetical protein SOI38_02785 [Eggerthellaceae bacterium]
MKNEYANASLPDGVARAIGTYKAEGGDLFFVSFSIDRDTIGNARVLAALRDSLPAGDDVRILKDGASAKFCELLYPHFCRFEKGLREAITIATCAEQGNFDDPRIIEIEEKLTLEALYTVLFYDSGFVKEAKNLAKGGGAFTREELKAMLDTLDERILWDVLFSDDDMPTFREQRIEIKDRRNDVMHYHKMAESVFDETRDLMKRVNAEIDSYLERVKSDVAYPKAKAESARVAAQMLSETYADMLESIQSSLDLSSAFDFSDQFGGISQLVAANIDTSRLASAIQAANSISGSVSLSRAAQEAMSAQALGLSSSVSKALEAMQHSTRKIDLGHIGAMQSAAESMKSLQASMNAQWADTFKGISDYYRHIMPPDTLDKLRFAASASMDFTAGLGVGSALSRAISAGELGDVGIDDDVDDADVDEDDHGEESDTNSNSE